MNLVHNCEHSAKPVRKAATSVVRVQRRNLGNYKISHLRRTRISKTVARFVTHFSLVVSMIFYILVGAAIFLWIETGSLEVNREIFLPILDFKSASDFLEAEILPQARIKHHETLLPVVRQLLIDVAASNSSNATYHIPGTEWSYGAAVLFTFSLLTTIGYGNVVPHTYLGRFFCIIYALWGIPIMLMCIGDMSKFFTEFLLASRESYLIWKWKNSKKKRHQNSPVESPDYVSHVPAPLLLSVFLIWLILGCVIYHWWEDIGLFDAFYFLIISLTTIGLGDIVPENNAFLALTCVYLTVGLMITTMTIEILAEYLRRLHYIGKKVKRLKEQIIWFGGKKITVQSLVVNVLTSLEVEQDVIDNAMLNMDTILEAAVDNNPCRAAGQVLVNSLLPVPQQFSEWTGGVVTPHSFKSAPLYMHTVKFIDDELSSARTRSHSIGDGSLKVSSMSNKL